MPEINTAITTIESAIERLYDLNVGAVGTGLQRHERPHKPAMLLAVMDLIAKGPATADKIRWSEEEDLSSGDTLKRYAARMIVTPREIRSYICEAMAFGILL